jgi:adenylate cyclase
MPKLINSIATKLFGDARQFLLEHRLFNTITLLSAVSNIGGAFVTLCQQNHLFLVLLNFITGILFLVFYLLSRLRNQYNSLYWPFISLIVVFLFVNSLRNAGSHGGAHYYFISALVMAVILSGKASRSVLAIALFCGAAISLLLVEHNYPSMITQFTNERERFFDVGGNLMFAQVFTAAIVQVLAQNLNEERRKSDQLLRNVLPESIALELKRTEKVQPVDYENATVLFTDFVGFTHIAESFTPQRVIAELDECFSGFDEIAKRHRLEKIKTIGDSYMAVGGVPVQNQTHAIDCVLAGLEIERFVNQLRNKAAAANRTYWQIRVGIHSGELVAGVVGSEKFSYDVWGDTVNTASRCESSGVPGRVNISATTYELVKDFFDCEYRGKVNAKNKGEIEMYFVERIRDEFSVNGEGTEPNRRFFEALEDPTRLKPAVSLCVC